MRTVSTENSVYEIDETGQRIRRVHGVNDPTPRQGEDGIWKSYTGIEQFDDGLLIVWGNNPDGSLKCTWTSKVISDNQD